MQKTIIKAGKIVNLTDARYFAAEEEVKYLGFNLEAGSSGYLDPMYMRAIREWVQGPTIVGEFGQTPISVVKEAATFFGLESVQIHLPEHIDEVADLNDVSLILEVDIARLSPSLITLWQPFASAFLVRVAADIQMEKVLEEYQKFPIIWSFDAPLPQIISLLESRSIYGLELIGGEEEIVGVKSFDELNEIFDYLTKETY
jgi:phosphoribosylanthranilate isomerase